MFLTDEIAGKACCVGGLFYSIRYVRNSNVELVLYMVTIFTIFYYKYKGENTVTTTSVLYKNSMRPSKG